MTSRRRALLPLLLVFLAFVILGGIGVVEFAIWLLLLTVWIWAFVFWGRADAREPDA